jgi:hypothetical protein
MSPNKSALTCSILVSFLTARLLYFTLRIAFLALPDLPQYAQLLDPVPIAVAGWANHFLSSSHAASFSIAL